MQIENLYSSLNELKKFIREDGKPQFKKTITHFNDLVLEIHKYMNPTDEWLKDEEFKSIFFIWCKSVSSEKMMNEARKTASIVDLKTCTKDINIAKQILVNAAKYGSMKFSESIKHIIKPAQPEPKEETKNKIDIQTLVKDFPIEIISKDNNNLKVKGELKPFEIAKIEKLTQLNLIIID